MLTVRPIAPGDVDAFVALHRRCDADAARALVAGSVQAFASERPCAQAQVFVLVDTHSPTLLGAAALSGLTGLSPPRSSYRRGVVVHASADLHMYNRAETLLIVNDHTGCAELGLPLLAAPDDAAAHAHAELLVDALLTHVAQHPARFAPTLLACLPGLRNADGSTPFWEALGRHFCPVAPPAADPFFPLPARSQLARLCPKHPIYSSLLEPHVRAAIGAVAPAARALARHLHQRGLRNHGHVDLFDAGPVLTVDVADLKAGVGSA